MDTDVSLSNRNMQLRAANALLKFCEEHGHRGPELDHIRRCILALENGDIRSAVESYLAVPLGGNGCFNDWWPPVIYPNETPEYVEAVFEALVTNWSLSMRLSVAEVGHETKRRL